MQFGKEKLVAANSGAMVGTELFVTDDNSQVQVFALDGTFLRSWDCAADHLCSVGKQILATENILKKEFVPDDNNLCKFKMTSNEFVQLSDVNGQVIKRIDVTLAQVSAMCGGPDGHLVGGMQRGIHKWYCDKEGTWFSHIVVLEGDDEVESILCSAIGWSDNRLYAADYRSRIQVFFCTLESASSTCL